MIREHLAVAYPGRRHVGLSLWVLDDGQIKAVAVGSVEHAAVAGVLGRFRPETLVVESRRETGVPPAPFRAEARKLRFVHPGWRDDPRTQPLGRVGVLAQNAWRMGFHELVRRGPYRIGSLQTLPLSAGWLDDHTPRRPS